jgi:hypothetical protein
MRKFNSNLATHSLINLLICAAGILVFILLIIIPTQKMSAELDVDIQKLHNRIDEQRILKPVFDNLLKQVKKKGLTNLPVTRKIKLARGDINQISEHLLGIARRCDLDLNDIQTDVKSLNNKDRFLLVRIQATGDFMRFREFLMDLGKIPSLEQIEEIHIRAIEANREFKVNIRLAQQ